MATAQSSTENSTALSGGALWIAATVLAMGAFLAVLNMTIANVSVINIAGNLGATISQSTWVITSFAVAEAITVPLTGWLSARFGAVRVFAAAMLLFGFFSGLCGLANSLELLVVMRVFQGLTGGLLLPLTQTLMLRIFPKDKATTAVGLWSTSSLVGPVLGPIVGGWICDNYTWPWLFYINVPLATLGSIVAWRLLKSQELPRERMPIDRTGLVLLVVWVGALQLMLDKGKDLDWFASTQIVVLALTAAIGFIAFLIWELTEAHPIVDLRVFRHRGFSATMVANTLGLGAFIGVMVLTPLWLQTNMSYTTTDAGLVMAWSGLFAVLASPLAMWLTTKIDMRTQIFAGAIWIGIVTLSRTYATTDMTYWQASAPLMLMGVGMPIFFIPLTGLAMSSVEERETASAAGLFNFTRTLSGAIATSLVATSWDNRTTINHAELAGLIDPDHSFAGMLENSGMPIESLRSAMDYLVTTQSIMLATNEVMGVLGITFVVASFSILLAPRPLRAVDPTAGGH